MKPLTISELAEMSAKAVKLGYGECVVCVSDDEEFNGSHELFERKFHLGHIVTYLNEKTKKTEKRPSLILV